MACVAVGLVASTRIRIIRTLNRSSDQSICSISPVNSNGAAKVSVTPAACTREKKSRQPEQADAPGDAKKPASQ